MTNDAAALTLAYDGSSRLVSVVAAAGGTAVERRYLWKGDQIVAETDAAGIVAKRFFDEGMKIDQGAEAGVYYYTRDQLRSIRELVDETGTMRARYTYSSSGVRTKVVGDVDAEFGFTGFLQGGQSDLVLARFRAYDPAIARWLSRDPLGELGGARDYDTAARA